jgi:acid phosphatase
MSPARPLLAGALLLALSACATTMAPHARAIPEGEAAQPRPWPARPRRSRRRRPWLRRLPCAAAWQTTTSTQSPGCRPRSSSGCCRARPSAARSSPARQGDQDAWLGCVGPPPSATCLPPGLPPALIVDIDETMLDNSPYQARLVRDGKSFDDASWND